MLKVGIAQPPVVMGDKKANVAALLAAVDQAGRARCDAVVLPECGLAGWLSTSAARAAEPVPGPFTRKLAGLARRWKLIVAAGLEERSDGKIYNSAVLIDAAGRLRLHHRKINELDLGLRVYSRGDRLAVTDIDGLRLGLDICADSWTPAVTDALHLMGARVILSPCAWAVEPGGEATNIAWITETYRARTAKRALSIAASNGVGPVTQGPWKGRILQGNGLVMGPDGKRLALLDANRPSFLAVDLPV
ncbi:MAG TPA: carbon-nitrogen hydrolase family protein [Planctomycetota bacterium]